MDLLKRITRNPEVMAGKPCIRGMRVTVGMVLNQLATGQTIAELLADFPYLERDDIFAALQYGAAMSQDKKLELAAS